MRSLSCKKLLALMLAVVMILTLVPHSVSADSSENLAFAA